MAIHTLAVLVENSPGVLARVASLFSRRGYNIDSLAVGQTENPKVSRMTIVLNLEGHALDQVSAQLFKLVNVIGISEMKDSDSLKREILLVKVANTAAAKAVVNKYKAVIADESKSTISIEAAMAINDRPVVVDFNVHRDAMVWPMVAAGTSNDDITVARSMAPVWDSQEL